MAGQIVSDGGSSGYYQLKIVNRKTGQVFYCEMGDVIASVYDNDFDMGNIAKAMRRIVQDRKGMGKAGNSAKYDAKKCVYFSEVLVQIADLEEKQKSQLSSAILGVQTPGFALAQGVK